MGRIAALRSIDLAVSDLRRSISFYSASWGLAEVSSEPTAAYLRGTGAEHHILAIHGATRPQLLSANFSVSDKSEVSKLHGAAVADGIEIVCQPAPLPSVAGGGYGFSLRTPTGFLLSFSVEVRIHRATTGQDRSHPSKLSHVVLNTTNVPDEIRFFQEFLGFRTSDTTDQQVFLRCGTDHHTVALAHGSDTSLNHVAYELPNFDGLMSAVGRMKNESHQLEWGVGRHGPGNNIFGYFVDPDGFAVEYSSDLDQVDDAVYMAHGPDYWGKFPRRPCRWGVATRPSARIIRAFSGVVDGG